MDNLNVFLWENPVEVNKIVNWTNNVGLQMSPNKSEAILFEKQILRGRRRRAEPNGIQMNGDLITYKDSIKFLGLTLDKKLNWAKHLIDLKAKAHRDP